MQRIMKNSPLQLDDALINQIRVETHEGDTIQVIQPTGLELDIKPCYARHKTDPLQWIVKLHVEFKPGAGQPLSYSGAIDCEGFFTIADSALPDATQRKIIAVNAATMLYGTAREAVAAITARGRHGRLLLPSVSFIDQVIPGPQPQPTVAPEEVST